MRIRSAILFLAIALGPASAFAQGKVITSDLYKWNASKASLKNVLRGSTTYFDSFEVDILKVKSGEKNNKILTSGDVEELIIIKEGELSVTVNNKSELLGPGSIAFLMPAQNYSYENKSPQPSVFYRLKFKSKVPLDTERGKSNGGSFMINWNNLEMKKTEPGGRRDYFNKPTSTCQKFEMHVTTLNEGLPSHAPHTHPEEEIILLLNGNATMQVNNKDYPMSAGDFVFAASGDFHGIRNSGKGQCEYFAFQWK